MPQCRDNRRIMSSNMFHPLLRSALLGTLINQDWRSSLQKTSNNRSQHIITTMNFNHLVNKLLNISQVPTRGSFSILHYNLYLYICIYLYLSVSNILHIQYMFFCLKERTTYTKTTRSMPGIGQIEERFGDKGPLRGPHFASLLGSAEESRGIRLP
jgi:hypothetical protein